MGGTKISRRRTLAGLACVALGAGGCYAVPPPLMYGADPVPAGHLRVTGTATGTILSDASVTSGAPPVPGVLLDGRYGLGHGASVGLRLFGAGAMVDGRLQLLHTPRLSLSLGLDVGAVHLLSAPPPSSPPTRAGPCPPGMYCKIPQPGSPGSPGSPSHFSLMGSVPLVLGWQVGRSTLLLGLRPGARMAIADFSSPGSNQISTSGTEPLAGALLGFDLPVSRRVTLELELDVTRSFVNPGTVTTLAIGIRN